jgi:hypothetical protein
LNKLIFPVSALDAASDDPVATSSETQMATIAARTFKSVLHVAKKPAQM